MSRYYDTRDPRRFPLWPMLILLAAFALLASATFGHCQTIGG